MKKILISSLISAIAWAGISATAFAATTTSSVQFTDSLNVGSTNTAEVIQLQQFLIDQGFLNIPAPTGGYFSMTVAAVEAFQAAHGISATGFFGPLTMAAANAVLSGVAMIPSTPATPPATVAIQSVTKPDTSLTAAVISFFTGTSPSRTITWQSNGYPSNEGVNINLIKKTSDSPVSYSLVRQLATNVSNTGTYSWKAQSGETGTDLYAEVTCANSATSASACQISAAPIQVQ
jgi:peptidoglycan hydrolase-like protein with peptidoglycan-binding domain